MRFHTATLCEAEYEPPSSCHFGITEGIAAAVAGGLGAAGVGAETAGVLGGIGAGGLLGAGSGAALSGLTGGDPLKGALTGGITGGAIGAAGPLSGALGIGEGVTKVGLGAAGGLLGSELTGQNPLTGALTGGAAGVVSGLTSTAGGPAPSSASVTPAAGTGGAQSAVAAAGPSAPTPVGGTNPVDLTSSSVLGDFSPRSEAPLGTTVGGTAGGGVSGSTGGAGSTFGDIGSKVMGLVEKNPGVVLGGGLLAANMLLGNKPLPAEAAIQQQAGEAASRASTLEAYQQSGTLPPGLESVVDQQFNAAKAAVVDQYAKEGLGSSTMMADKLNALRTQKAGEIAQFADQLAKQGIQWENLSAQEFGTLLNAQAAQDEAFTKALGSFAGGLAGLRGTTTTTTG